MNSKQDSADSLVEGDQHEVPGISTASILPTARTPIQHHHWYIASISHQDSTDLWPYATNNNPAKSLFKSPIRQQL